MRESNGAPLVRRSPYESGLTPFSAFRQEMDRLFDSFFSPDRLGGFGLGDFPFSPAVDVSESDKEICVRAELPGVDEKDVELSLDGDMLTIRGEKREERRDEGDRRRIVERAYGAFERTIRLPFEPKEDTVKAQFKNGVLTVTAARPPELTQSTRRIPISRV